MNYVFKGREIFKKKKKKESKALPAISMRQSAAKIIDPTELLHVYTIIYRIIICCHRMCRPPLYTPRFQP